MANVIAKIEKDTNIFFRTKDFFPLTKGKQRVKETAQKLLQSCLLR